MRCLAFLSTRARFRSAGSRVLVQRSIYPKFLEAMTEKARTIKLGPPPDRSTKMGPLVSKEQYDRVFAYQQLGEVRSQAGARRRQAGFDEPRLLRGTYHFLRR